MIISLLLSLGSKLYLEYIFHIKKEGGTRIMPFFLCLYGTLLVFKIFDSKSLRWTET